MIKKCWKNRVEPSTVKSIAWVNNREIVEIWKENMKTEVEDN